MVARTAPLWIASNTSAALARKVAGSALCGKTEGRVRNRQPFLFSSSGWISGAGPDAAPNSTTRPKGAVQSSDPRKVCRATESYTTPALRPPVASITCATQSGCE